ncbi:hypothetical protein FRC03_011735 [Tulasnella sp. 419]|nr:hypothetical protein FRC03_011735 [Tulasnella sp. 419]
MPPVRLTPNQAAIDSRRPVSLTDISIFWYSHSSGDRAIEQSRGIVEQNQVQLTENRNINGEVVTNYGQRRIRGIKPEVYYNWEMSKAPSTINTPIVPVAGRVGDIRFHCHDNGVQVWVLDGVPGSSPSRLHWVAKEHAGKHPTLSTHYLSMQKSDFPSWVTWNTITNYASKNRCQKRESTPHVSSHNPSSSTTTPVAIGRRPSSMRVQFARKVAKKGSK